jgi:hypothetical protein
LQGCFNRPSNQASTKETISNVPEQNGWKPKNTQVFVCEIDAWSGQMNVPSVFLLVWYLVLLSTMPSRVSLVEPVLSNLQSFSH